VVGGLPPERRDLSRVEWAPLAAICGRAELCRGSVIPAFAQYSDFCPPAREAIVTAYCLAIYRLAKQ
jgi:hypothetical protein